MGVQGLTTFVDENQHLLTDLRLHDTQVVIDGNNLYFFLYKLYGVSYSYGGDYNTYANSVTSYFTTLKSVGIQPYVVFDGCYDSDDRKLQTILKRARDKIATSNSMSRGAHGNLIPLMAFVIFRDVLADLGIWHVTMDEEADGEIASLANKLGCPVMSNDSDFYIYDLKHGFILFDYLNLQTMVAQDKNGKEYKYLPAQVYYLDNLLKSYSRLTRESVPLFATVMGNDFVEQKHFDDFFKRANVTLGRRQTSQKRSYKMAQVLKWMNNYKGDLFSKVLECVPKEKRDKVKELIDFSIHSYTEISAVTSPKSSDTTWKSFDGNPFPDWFISASREGKIFTHFLNALVLRKVFVPCQVELKRWPSAMNSCNSLRQILYCIILSLDAESENKTELSVTEYTRDIRELVKKELPLSAVTPGGVSIPNMKELPSMDANRKEKFFYHCLEIDPYLLDAMPRHLKVLVALLIFFVKNVQPKVTKSFICSLVICFIKLSVIDQNPEDGNLKDFTLPDLHKAKERLKKYAQPVALTHANPFKGEIVHSVCQFQACWWATLQLNNLLMLPDKLPSLATTINGSFIYNLYSDLSSRMEQLSFIQELLGGNTTVKGHFDLIMNAITQHVSDDAFEEQAGGKTKKSRKKNKTKRKQELSDQHGTLGDSDSEKPPKWEANCDLSNRFSKLLKDT